MDFAWNTEHLAADKEPPKWFHHSFNVPINWFWLCLCICFDIVTLDFRFLLDWWPKFIFDVKWSLHHSHNLSCADSFNFSVHVVSVTMFWKTSVWNNILTPLWLNVIAIGSTQLNLFVWFFHCLEGKAGILVFPEKPVGKTTAGGHKLKKGWHTPVQPFWTVAIAHTIWSLFWSWICHCMRRNWKRWQQWSVQLLSSLFVLFEATWCKSPGHSSPPLLSVSHKSTCCGPFGKWKSSEI